MKSGALNLLDFAVRDRGYDIYSLRCFLADAGWVSGNKTHRPELRTPLASWQGMAREARRDWLVAWVCLHY